MGKQKGSFPPGKYGHDLLARQSCTRKRGALPLRNHAPYRKACKRNPASANPEILTYIGQARCADYAECSCEINAEEKENVIRL